MPFLAPGDLDDMPWFDPDTKSLVVGYSPDQEFRVEVWPMLFNDRICVTHRDSWPHTVVAGFCYDKGHFAPRAAAHWLDHWDELDEPEGHKKVAFNILHEYGKGTRA